MFLVGCGRVVSRAGLFGSGPGSGLSLSKSVGPMSCLHTNFFLQTTGKQSYWFNLDLKWLTVNYLVIFSLLRYRHPAVAHILTHSVNLSFGTKSGFKHKCHVLVSGFGFRLQNWGPFTTLFCRVICILTKAWSFDSCHNLTYITYFNILSK